MRELISFEQLNEVMEALHDCPFDLDRAGYSEADQEWTGVFLRPLWDDPRAEIAGVARLYRRIRLPVANAVVNFAGVGSARVVNDHGIGRYSFNEVERTGEGVRLRFNEDMRIEHRLIGPMHVTYREQPAPMLRAVYHQVLSLEAGPSIEKVIGPEAE